MIQSDKIIKSLRLTEKSNAQSSELGQYTFEVFPNTTKGGIKAAVEKVFDVKVVSVNVVNMPGKPSRNRKTGKAAMTSGFKKAIVTLKKGDTIEIV